MAASLAASAPAPTPAPVPPVAVKPMHDSALVFLAGAVAHLGAACAALAQPDPAAPPPHHWLHAAGVVLGEFAGNPLVAPRDALLASFATSLAARVRPGV